LWLFPIAGVVFLSVIAATWSVVFMFAVRGRAVRVAPADRQLADAPGRAARGLAALIVVIVTVVVAILAGVFALAIYREPVLNRSPGLRFRHHS